MTTDVVGGVTISYATEVSKMIPNDKLRHLSGIVGSAAAYQVIGRGFMPHSLFL